jgi:outer membrane protein OmpA-like peptidoglycan-associated protein
MRKISALFLISVFISTFLFSQENPKIDKKTFFSSTLEIEKAKKDFKIAERHYANGIGTYDEALKHYLKLYGYNSNSPALNYKIGVCYLFTSNKKASLTYFLNSPPEIAKDYYLLLGRSYQTNLKYDEAKEAYAKYNTSLSRWKRFDFRKDYNQLVSECDASQEIMKEDSLPVFIINLGPVINSYYDDYGAYLPASDSNIYVTSKRPEVEPRKKVSRFKFKEQLLVSNNCIHQPSNYAIPIPKLDFSNNTSLAGVDQNKKQIYFYKGGADWGRLFAATFNGKKWKVKELKGKINHIAYKETSISIADDGTTYFVTNRRGGEGGKDIWVCQQKREFKFSKPKNLGKTINTAFDEEGVFISHDGNTLYFSSKGRKGMGGFDVYKTEKKTDGNWSEPKNMGYPINSMADELFYHPTADTMVALISTIRDNSYGGLDIYKIQFDPRIPFKLIGSVTDVENGTTLPAIVTIYEGKLQIPIKTATVDSLAGIYMHNFEDSGRYVIQVDYEGYKSVTEEIACPETKFATIVQDFKLEKLKHPFTLIGKVSDIDNENPLLASLTFKQVGVDSIMGRVVTIDSTGKYSITFDDKYDMILDVAAEGYFSAQEPINATNEMNPIISKNIQLKKSKIDYTLTGRITQENGQDPVHAALSFYRPGETEPFTIVVSDSTEGKYQSIVDQPGPFLIEVEAPGYFFLNETFQFNDGQTFVAKNFVLKKMETGVKIVIENILFNSGKATLVASSFPELDKLANLLLTNPKVRIEVSGHTDNVGSASVNKKISKERALTVRNYLISRGVEEDRVEYQGYGFDQPIASNDTPEGKAQNRRVEIKILQ